MPQKSGLNSGNLRTLIRETDLRYFTVEKRRQILEELERDYHHELPEGIEAQKEIVQKRVDGLLANSGYYPEEEYDEDGHLIGNADSSLVKSTKEGILRDLKEGTYHQEETGRNLSDYDYDPEYEEVLYKDDITSAVETKLKTGVQLSPEEVAPYKDKIRKSFEKDLKIGDYAIIFAAEINRAFRRCVDLSDITEENQASIIEYFKRSCSLESELSNLPKIREGFPEIDFTEVILEHEKDIRGTFLLMAKSPSKIHPLRSILQGVHEIDLSSEVRKAYTYLFGSKNISIYSLAYLRKETDGIVDLSPETQRNEDLLKEAFRSTLFDNASDGFRDREKRFCLSELRMAEEIIPPYRSDIDLTEMFHANQEDIIKFYQNSLKRSFGEEGERIESVFEGLINLSEPKARFIHEKLSEGNIFRAAQVRNKGVVKVALKLSEEESEKIINSITESGDKTANRYAQTNFEVREIVAAFCKDVDFTEVVGSRFSLLLDLSPEKAKELAQEIPQFLPHSVIETQCRAAFSRNADPKKDGGFKRAKAISQEFSDVDLSEEIRNCFLSSFVPEEGTRGCSMAENLNKLGGDRLDLSKEIEAGARKHIQEGNIWILRKDWAMNFDPTEEIRNNEMVVRAAFLECAKNSIDTAGELHVALSNALDLEEDVSTVSDLYAIINPVLDLRKECNTAFLYFLSRKDSRGMENIQKLIPKESLQFGREEFISNFQTSKIPLEEARTYVSDDQFKEFLGKDEISASFNECAELALALKNNSEEVEKDPKRAAENSRILCFQTEGYLKREDKEWFDKLSQKLGAKNIARFMGTHERSYLHIAGANIIRLFEASGLERDTFCGQVLMQVISDTSNHVTFSEEPDWDGFDENYDDEPSVETVETPLSNYQYFNNILEGINYDFEETLQEAEAFSNPDLQSLVKELRSASPCQSWKHLQKYHDLCQMLRKKEVFERLEELPPRRQQFFSQLAFHPNISMERVFEFMEKPEVFLDLADEHSEESHERKKPSNYLSFPHLDISAEDLRDALVDGSLDHLQFFPEYEIDYRIPTPIVDSIIQAIGRRSEGIPGRARNVKETFKRLNVALKAHRLNVRDIISKPEIITPELKREIESIIFDPEIGIRENRKVEEYKVKVHLKSSPEGHVAGNDTACCMPFGSGKNNVYMYNLACATLTVQRKVGGKYRTIDQSVLTPDVDIDQSVPDVIHRLMADRTQLADILTKDLSQNSEIFLTADNIEVAPNYKGSPENERVTKYLYANFLRRYLSQLEETHPKIKFNKDRLIVGKGYTDITGLPPIQNTFVPTIPPGYSDNTGEEAFELTFDDYQNSLEAEATEQTVLNIPNSQEQQPTPSIRGVRLLTAKDTIRVAYMEGKIYADNESLIQYIHRIGNELIAKDINNQHKNRPNLSLIAEDRSGNALGYLIAYEGVTHKTDDDQVAHDSEEPRRAIYVSDLASQNKTAGGSLIKAFQTMIEENYLKNGDLIPIIAEARETTSYPLIQRHLNRLGKKYGVQYEMREVDQRTEGGDTMHVVILEPHKTEA